MHVNDNDNCKKKTKLQYNALKCVRNFLPTNNIYTHDTKYGETVIQRDKIPHSTSLNLQFRSGPTLRNSRGEFLLPTNQITAV